MPSIRDTDFLSENANFAKVCEASEITFIGPTPEVIEMMGEKDRARREMKALGVATVPGSEGVVEGEEQLAKEAKRIGFPLIIKASAGGGGRGMRVVHQQEELLTAYETARSEAQQAFGTPDVYAEKFLEHPRHIEFQVLGDQHGKVIHLGERECSIQRRHQKLVEESPSPVMDAKKRKDLGAKVVRALEKVGYTNAGTVEFLMDEDGSIYFIEMNARIQVEHPVTELVTGVDLIKAQIRIAAGENLDDCRRGNEFLGPRDRMPHQCRGSGDVCAVGGAHHHVSSPGWDGSSRGFGGVCQCSDSALLRLDDRETDCKRPRPRGSHWADEAGAGNVRHRGNQDFHSAAPADSGRCGLCGRAV